MAFQFPTFLQISTPVCSASNSGTGNSLPSPSAISNHKPIKIPFSSCPGGDSNLFSAGALKFEKKNKKFSFKTDVSSFVSACAIDEKDHVLIKIEECSDDTVLYKFGNRLSVDQSSNVSVDSEDAQASGNSSQLEYSKSETEASGFETGAISDDPPFVINLSVPESESMDSSQETDLNIQEDETFDPISIQENFPIDGNGKSDDNVKHSTSKFPLHFESGVVMLPHPAKAARGGEDAYFIENDWIGVADGVSVWAELGVNSGLYSRELMWNCSEVVRMEEIGFHPELVIEEGHSRTDLMGSCTIAVACINCRNVRVANIGDSGFIVVRDGKVVAQSIAMMHAFSEPYQIGTEGTGRDDPSSAEIYDVEVEPGDVLVLATDGLFDNVYTETIAEIVDQTVKQRKNAETCARRLANRAQKQGCMTTGKTPYSEEAKIHGQNHEGGRRDDVTVIVSYIV